MNYVDLSGEGFPNYRLWENGKVFNRNTGCEVLPTNGRYVTLYCNGGHKTFAVAILRRRYFTSELRQLPPQEVMKLDFLGLSNYSVTFDGRLWTHRTETWMNPTQNQNGYVESALVKDDGTTKHFKLHRLVALAFVPNPHGYDQVDHIDGVKTHNGATNLQWISNTENARRARHLGLKPMQLTEKEIHKACRMIILGEDDKVIAKACHTYPMIIYHIRKGHTHCDISKLYGIEEHRIRGRKIDWSKYTKYQKNFKHYTPKVDTDDDDIRDSEQYR